MLHASFSFIWHIIWHILQNNSILLWLLLIPPPPPFTNTDNIFPLLVLVLNYTTFILNLLCVLQIVLLVYTSQNPVQHWALFSTMPVTADEGGVNGTNVIIASMKKVGCNLPHRIQCKHWFSVVKVCIPWVQMTVFSLTVLNKPKPSSSSSSMQIKTIAYE